MCIRRGRALRRRLGISPYFRGNGQLPRKYLTRSFLHCRAYQCLYYHWAFSRCRRGSTPSRSMNFANNKSQRVYFCAEKSIPQPILRNCHSFSGGRYAAMSSHTQFYPPLRVIPLYILYFSLYPIPHIFPLASGKFDFAYLSSNL